MNPVNVAEVQIILIESPYLHGIVKFQSRNVVTIAITYIGAV